jgi:hypothetical protein
MTKTANTIRVRVTRQLMERLAAGESLRFNLPAASDGITSVEVEFAEDKTIFDQLDKVFDRAISGVDALLDRVFKKSTFSDPSK